MARVELMRKNIRVTVLATLTIVVVAIMCVTQFISNPSNQRPRQTHAGRRISGIIDHYNEGTQGVLNAPDTVKTNKQFQLVINTFGNDCEERGAADVAISPAATTINVFDFTTARPGEICGDVHKRLPHTVTLEFGKPGEVLIRILGERIMKDSRREPAIIEHRIIVTP